MTREEAIRKAIDIVAYFEAHFAKSKEAREDTVNIIEALEQELETRWIPVSERLPEDSGDYLTTTMYGEVYCDYWTGINFNRQEVIIAWQPLPEPYKAESEDEEQ